MVQLDAAGDSSLGFVDRGVSYATRIYGVPGLCILTESRSAATLVTAKTLAAPQRQQLALAALAGTQSISQLADTHHVSRKFVAQQAHKAQTALDQAFAPLPPRSDERVLFHLPVTKAWLRQLTLGLVLICHSPLRGVHELLRDVFDYPVALGTIHNRVARAVPQARQHNEDHDLSRVRIGALDEIFQAGRPVLVGCDADSTYCYLLSQEEQRDAETWGRRLGELVERGFDPEATIADGAPAIRAGQRQVLPDVPCRGDVFHIPYEEVGPLVRVVESQAYQAIALCGQREKKLATPGKRRDKNKASWGQQLRHAHRREAQAIALCDDVSVLARWLREDILAVNGLSYPVRQELYDFVLEELQSRRPVGPAGLASACTALSNQREDLLAFAAQRDRDLLAIAAESEVSVAWVREALQLHQLSPRDERHGPRTAALRRVLRGRCHAVCTAVARVAAAVVRASSVVENVNSRLRNYFFLRRQIGPESLTLLQFFLNQRRFLRSERAEREGKSPAELLSGHEHKHWLELLGERRFTRAA